MSETPSAIIASQLEADDDFCLRSYDIGAKHIIAALATAGFKILPREPTEAMTQAGYDFQAQAYEMDEVDGKHDTRNIFRQMWDAAP